MEIRFLNAGDAAESQRPRLQALPGDAEAFSATWEEHRSLRLEEAQRRLWSDGDAFVVGAFQEGRLMGMAGF